GDGVRPPGAQSRRARDPARRRAGPGRGPRADALGPGVPAPGRPRPLPGRDRLAARALRARLGGTAARRRPLHRRLHPQGAREARDGASRLPVHPHPRGLRLPLLARDFTPSSHLL
ncbi:MAG: hypothetical protein AVDCRST_MAG53-2470, partial [uncultured Solirubrobacteraceae bacterium]